MTAQLTLRQSGKPTNDDVIQFRKLSTSSPISNVQFSEIKQIVVPIMEHFMEMGMLYSPPP